MTRAARAKADARLTVVSATYDRIGIGHDQLRKPDPRLAAVIGEALGRQDGRQRRSGRGSCEPPAQQVAAVEPSAVMLAQHRGARRVPATVEAPPFPHKAGCRPRRRRHVRLADGTRLTEEVAEAIVE
jgi:hypothetical protein